MGKRKIIIAIAVIVVVAGIYCYLEHREQEFKLITDEGEMSLFVKNSSQAELDEYYKKVDELLAQDIYGGDTPEETLELYIKALEARDFELASKYFVFRDQEKEFGELVSLTNKQLDDYLEFIDRKDYKKSCNNVFMWCEIDVFYEGEDILIARFKQIEQSKLWKLESI